MDTLALQKKFVVLAAFLITTIAFSAEKTHRKQSIPIAIQTEKSKKEYAQLLGVFNRSLALCQKQHAPYKDAHNRIKELDYIRQSGITIARHLPVEIQNIIWQYLPRCMQPDAIINSGIFDPMTEVISGDYLNSSISLCSDTQIKYYVGFYNDRNKWQCITRDIASGNLLSCEPYIPPYTCGYPNINDACYSHDGKLAAWHDAPYNAPHHYTSRGTMHIYDCEARQLLLKFTAPPVDSGWAPSCAIYWSSDNKKIAYESKALYGDRITTIYINVFDIESKQHTVLTFETNRPTVYSLLFSSDTRYLIADGRQNLAKDNPVIFDLTTNSRVPLEFIRADDYYNNETKFHKSNWHPHGKFIYLHVSSHIYYNMLGRRMPIKTVQWGNYAYKDRFDHIDIYNIETKKLVRSLTLKSNISSKIIDKAQCCRLCFSLLGDKFFMIYPFKKIITFDLSSLVINIDNLDLVTDEKLLLKKLKHEIKKKNTKIELLPEEYETLGALTGTNDRDRLQSIMTKFVLPQEEATSYRKLRRIRLVTKAMSIFAGTTALIGGLKWLR